LESRRDAVAAVTATALLVAVPLRTLDQATTYRVVRSDDEVAYARHTGPLLREGPLLVEQSWRFGGRLYWPWGREIVDVDEHNLAAVVAERMERGPVPALIAVSAGTCRATACEDLLTRLGFVEERALDRHRLFRPPP